jgi:phosphoribosylamine-glycine ligase
MLELELELAASVIDVELDRVCDMLLVNEEDPLNDGVVDRVCEELDVNDGE